MSSHFLWLLAENGEAMPSTRKEGVTFSSLAVSALIIFAIGGWFGNWSHNERGLWWAWTYPTELLAGLASTWYIFAWAALLSSIVAIVLIRNQVPTPLRPRTLFIGGLLTSLRAGVLEELVFRWLLVLSAPVGITILNTITFGLVKWLHVHALLPLANWATFGILEPQLHASNGVMAAALLVVAAVFRNGHAYLGPFGFVNAWFLGMVMFYLVFNFGLITAIVAHVLYDAIIFSTLALSARFQPRQVFW